MKAAIIEKRKIILCFNSPDEQKIVTEHLASLGYEILAYHEDGGTQADMFILDVPSARRIGDDVLSIKKSSDIFVPAIVLLGKDDDMNPWLSAGFDNCLRMPFTKSEIKADVEILLRLRQQSEEITRRSESRYQAIFEATGTATLIVEEDATIVMANRTCLFSTGYSPKELIGTKWIRYVAPESLEMMLGYHKLRREDSEKAPFQYEVKLVNKAGEVRNVILQVSMVPETSQSIVSMLDITERKQAEIELNRQREILQRIFDHIPLMIAYFDERGNIKIVNHELVKKLGWSLEEWKAENIFAKCYPEPEALKEALDFMISNPIAWKDFKTTTKYGTVIDTTWTNILLADGVSMGIGQDITERKQAEEALKERENQLQSIFRAAPIGIGVVQDRILIEVNARICEMTGFTPEELIGKSAHILYPTQKEFEYVGEEKYRQIAEKGTGVVETRWMKKDGSIIDVLLSSTPIDLKDTSKGVIFTALNITERKQAEEAFRLSENRFRALFEQTGVGVAVIDSMVGRFVQINQKYCDIVGYSPEEMLATTFQSITHPDDLTADLDNMQLLREGRIRQFSMDKRYYHKGGWLVWVNLTVSPLWQEGESTDFHIAVLEDITERKQAEDKLRQASINWSRTFDAIQDGIALLDANQHIINSNQAFLDFIDKTKEDVIGNHCFSYIHGTNCPIEGCPFVRMRQSKQRETMEMQINGLVCEIMVDPILDENQNIIGAVHIITDITERKLAEAALCESEESYRRLFEDHSAVKWLIDPDSGNIVDANKAAADFYGWSREELKQMKIQQINILPPEEIKKEIEKARTLKKTHFEFRHRLADGSIRDVRVFSSKIKIKGKDYLHSIIQDVTKEKEIEAQLHQSQKLESIGQLAGGVAHDFNNMLNVILGYGEIMLNKLHHGDPLREDARQIVEAGKRSMALTHQLLAFSRKQTLQPMVLNINESLKTIEKMLRRLIGEDIDLVMALEEDISYVKVDSGQIEQVIMNLAVNARDAMPYGGKLIIETANVVLDESYTQNHAGAVPGEYVMIAVTDTGSGMDKETLFKIFEPFFTTKGKGTGLGLSTVYGIVKQSGGNIWGYSEPAKGTTFKIYLPATLSEPQLEEVKIEKDAHKGGGEHILIVEDEPALQGLFETLLSDLGYRVTVAANGGEALLLVEEKGLIPDLVITDVIMPVMSGDVLVNRLRKNQPDIKVLYMSGYTGDAIVHHGVFDEGTHFIQKPFNIKDLAAKIEQLLRV